ncbi:LacI family DNA-binding transcriptional regulator [Pseudonocardia charpentierae]|uniref:LacI family DNA-binding transcriptional regulator n=1 Tax=Pseudonocardia charpentierae TaxID=3075545 RepID=A0ABU2NDB9_9PSEU|nr:LacI family DNA-binding transcriptional regulator [Pseudonocardia sp. DSM 45834]MDT0351859.1 LacI family DNA-binding transcriptional regulator [Pseudonocardia sp. DSM 45834]
MTIRDVATRAGVSPATVSRVFSQPETVAPGTRQRVLTAAEELRYAPNPVARSLARRRTGNLGIVVPDIANSFSAMIIKAAQQEARHAEYALFVTASEELVDDEERQARALAPQVDGLLLTSPQASDACLRELADIVPVVVTNRLLDSVPAVLTESAQATGHAVEHLHALGHREVAYLAGPDGYSNQSRTSGLQAACARLGLEPVVLGPFPARFSSGVRAADLVLAAGVTAVVAFNDDIAAGLLTRFADRGVRVPEQISVVGHDDTALAEMVTPRLTTVHIPAAAAGATATQLLIRYVRGDDSGVRRYELPSELIVRGSTGPVTARST